MSRKNEVTYKRTAGRNRRGSIVRSVFGYLKDPARSFVMLATAGLLSFVSSHAIAQQLPGPGPKANRVFFECTFTTINIQNALTISNSNKNKLAGGQVQASYILIYVRGNPNDGQRLAGTTPAYTGPVLCVNSDTEAPPAQTTEGTPIPNSINQPLTKSVDILGGEEALHLQYKRNPGGVIEKRVCHTVAGITDCFFIQPR